MLPKKRRQSWRLQAEQRGPDDRTVTLSQIVHLSLRCMVEPDANFDRQRRPYAPILQKRVRCAMTRTAPSFRQPQRDHAAFLSARMMVTNLVAQREWSEAMKYKDRISEREYQDRLESLLKGAVNTQLRPLMSLETATKKRRAQKKKAASNSGFTKSTMTTSG